MKYAFEDVRRLDPERYKLASLAPASQRDGLLALLAFNMEVARIPELVSDPTLGLIRLQWWREALSTIYAGEEKDLGHPVAELLRHTVTRFNLTEAHFITLLDTRALDMAEEPIPDVANLEAYAIGTSGILDKLFMEVLGQRDENSMRAAEHIGAAWAMTGLIRAIPFHAKTGRVYIPTSILMGHGLNRGTLLTPSGQKDLSGVLAEVSALIEAHLEEARDIIGSRFNSTTAPVFLKSGVINEYRNYLRLNNYDLFSDRVISWRASSFRLLMCALFKKV